MMGDETDEKGPFVGTDAQEFAKTVDDSGELANVTDIGTIGEDVQANIIQNVLVEGISTENNETSNEADENHAGDVATKDTVTSKACQDNAKDDANLESHSTLDTLIAAADASNPDSSGSQANYDPKNVQYEGDVAVYTDPKTGTKYEWSTEKNEWVLRYEMGYENDTHVYTDKDGVKFFWDKEKSAWFPKLDDDFMATYQMSYGFVDNSSSVNDEEKEEDEDEEAKKAELAQVKAAKGEKRKASEPSWFELNETENTKVYVSNLPTEITEQEFIDLMQKCGLVMKDPVDGSFKIKLYKVAGTDILKGDALCTYIRVESVDLALKLLDGSEYNGKRLKVERAKFQMKGQYDPKLKPKMKKRKEKMKLRKIQDKLLDWRPEKIIGERAKHERTVIIRNLFDPAIFDTDVSLILEFQEDLREEAAKIGQVNKVMIYDRHPEGVAQINMSSPEEADEVVKMLNGRWFMKRQLTAEIWDGKTKFKIAETDSQITQRLDGWDKFLEDDASAKPVENK